MVLDNASLGKCTQTTSMKKNLPISVHIMVFLMVTFTFVEFEADVMVSH
jgi:hypothetical protein